MKLGILLEKLIEIAKISKTDFAISVDMTPSGLSKILSGKRLPFYKDKKFFAKKAANCLAEEIYDDKCYLKFEGIFPFLYDFETKHELEAFLVDAIDYSMMLEYAAENNENLHYPDKETSILGKKSVLNLFCILVSDGITDALESPLEFFSSIHAHFYRLYGDVLKRVKILGARKLQRTVTLNHFFPMAFLEAAPELRGMDIFSYLVKAHRHFDLNLWQTKEDMSSTFLLLKNRFLLVFNIQIDGTPLMTVIRHKSYLSAFFTTLSKMDANKISYNTQEAAALVEADSSSIQKLLNSRMDVVYNFISIGYLVRREDLTSCPASAAAKNFMLRHFDNILTKDTAFYVTIEAMMNFFATGKVVVPLVGVVDIEPDQRVPYLERFNHYLQEKNHDKVKIINSEPPKVAVFCLKGLSVVYVTDSNYENERIHCFETDAINDALRHEMSDGHVKMLNFNPDLWSVYMDELANRLADFA